MENTKDREPLGPFQKIEFLKREISKATDQKPFYIKLENAQFTPFDFSEGVIPQRAKVIDLIKRNPTRKNPDQVVVQIGPYRGHDQIFYACFPISVIEIEGNSVLIDCTRVYKEGFLTSLPNFFVERSQN